MTRVLITGANSFVGANFCKYSNFDSIEEVSLLDKRPEDINYGKYDVVLHLAAIVHQSNKIEEEEYFRVNRDLCLEVASHAKKSGIRQFVFLSTLKVYGGFINSSELRNENSECFPDDAYGKSKYAAEKDLKKLEDKNFIVSIIRTPLVYGEGVKANMMSLIKLVDLLPVLPFDKIENRRNLTYVANLVGFIDKIIEKSASGVFIAMDMQAHSTTEIINYISESMGKKVLLVKLPGIILRFLYFLVPDKLDKLFGSFEFENNCTRQQLDYQPSITTEECIKRMVSFYLENK